MIQEELIRSLLNQIEELERKLARMSNAHLIQAIERDHLNTKVYGPNLHPAAIRCGCPECVSQEPKN